MLERFQLCKEFGWTPAQLDEVPEQEIRDFKEVIRWRAFYQERERAKQERASR